MIINLRGNNGSGKSTVARLLMDKGRQLAGSTENLKIFKIVGCKRPWAVVGCYTTACGGLDTLNKVNRKRIPELIQEAVDLGCNVFLEGVLYSDYYGKLGEYSAQFGNQWIFAYMDTPVEECLRRVQYRRQMRGNTKPFDPNKKLYPRHKGILRSRLTIEQVHKRRTVTLPWQDPMSTLMKLIRKEG